MVTPSSRLLHMYQMNSVKNMTAEMGPTIYHCSDEWLEIAVEKVRD